MIKVQNILILAALCISIYTAVIPIISPVKIDIKFQKWNGNGLSIWEIIFSQSCSCIRCPSGFVIEKGKCICPKGSIIIKDGRCIPDPTMDSIRE